jgi:prepilin-type processing-associated H-X9-DG protein
MSSRFDNDPAFDDITPKKIAGPRFTLGHLMLTVAIIAVVIALLLPFSRSSRPAARRAQCINNLKQIALALLNYKEVYKAFPPAYTVDANGRPLHSWRTLILPFSGHEPLYQTIDLSKPWNDPANAKALVTDLAFFHCPASDAPSNTTTYLATLAPNGCLIPNKSRRLTEITDPQSATLMVIEAGEENAVPWMAPFDADESLVLSLGPATKLDHAGGGNACLVDGSVRFLKVSTSASVRKALFSISGNDNKSILDW